MPQHQEMACDWVDVDAQLASHLGCCSIFRCTVLCAHQPLDGTLLQPCYANMTPAVRHRQPKERRVRTYLREGVSVLRPIEHHELSQERSCCYSNSSVAIATQVHHNRVDHPLISYEPWPVLRNCTNWWDSCAVGRVKTPPSRGFESCDIQSVGRCTPREHMLIEFPIE